MAKLLTKQTMSLFIIFMAIINQSSPARTLINQSSNHHHHHQALTFVMPDILASSSKPSTTKFNGPFPPETGMPFSQSDPTFTNTGFSSQTQDMSGIGSTFFPTSQELEFGNVTSIIADLFVGSEFGSPYVGKAQGIYVASSEDENSHMMAMTVFFASGEFKDGLRFFGVHRTDVTELHIAVIGGTGKYSGANGYATIRSVTSGYNFGGEESEGGYNKLLLFHVYLSH
ncbi:Dirigent protein [Dillenia turbinata]|uniref:Dirigent protein n=1 Tax=Dillenia turbinata TaxID=194707 RepID=A0AAN8ZG24_9MAGN